MIQMLNGIEGLVNTDKNVKFEILPFNVAEANQHVEKEFNTEASTGQILGVALVATDDDALDASTLELRIGGATIFPKDFECKMLRAGMEVAPNQRFFIFNKAEDVDRSQIQVRYQDGGQFTGTYNVHIYLLAFEK